MHYQGNKISNIKSRNHVNFKSLCVYLDVSPNYPTMSIDEIVTTLIPQLLRRSYSLVARINILINLPLKKRKKTQFLISNNRPH